LCVEGVASLNIFLFCSDELYVTAGATHGINVLSSVFFEAGDTIYVEDPSYFIAFKMFKMANFNIVGGKKRICFTSIDRSSV